MAIFTNQATLSYNGISVNSNIVTGNITETLAISKTAVGNTYSPDDTVVYIVSLNNNGTTDRTDVTVTDNLGAYDFGATTLVPLDYVGGSALYYIDGVLQGAPTVASANPLTFTGITIPAGGNAILIYKVQTNEFAPLATQSTITNEATATFLSSAPISDTETVTVEEAPELTIIKALDPVNVPADGELTYTFTVQNTGNTAALATDNVVITDTFDPALTGITVSLNGVILPASSYTYNEATGEFATNPGVITVPAATFTQNLTTGEWVETPGISVLEITGTI